MVHYSGKVWWQQECEVAGHIAFTVGKHIMNVYYLCTHV